MRTALILSFFLALISIACSKEIKNNVELAGTWQLTAFLSDPGDLSGQWKTYNGQPSFLRLHGDGSAEANGVIDSHYDRYHIADHQTLFLISSSGGDSIRYSYQLSSSQLTLWGPCREPCGKRFKKLR